jgi:hypothetical protein
MRLVEQWRRIEDELPLAWADARLRLAVPDAERLDRAAALLGPANPGRSDGELRFATSRSGPLGPDAVRRLLDRIDRAGIEGELVLVAAQERATEATAPRTQAASDWDAALAALPPDWSDLWVELELSSSDHLQRAALHLAPVNPSRNPDASSFRFRVARVFGYGASPEMTRRCLERLDGEGIPGRVEILRALSDTHNVATQGPVWRVEGKAV